MTQLVSKEEQVFNQLSVSQDNSKKFGEIFFPQCIYFGESLYA
jgi:hypothetical protein